MTVKHWCACSQINASYLRDIKQFVKLALCESFGQEGLSKRAKMSQCTNIGPWWDHICDIVPLCWFGSWMYSGIESPQTSKRNELQWVISSQHLWPLFLDASTSRNTIHVTILWSPIKKVSHSFQSIRPDYTGNLVSLSLLEDSRNNQSGGPWLHCFSQMYVLPLGGETRPVHNMSNIDENRELRKSVCKITFALVFKCFCKGSQHIVCLCNCSLWPNF